jgi:glycosyltransferase involved in cell wall biosynthesis
LDDQRPDVSVVVPAYNVSSTLKNAVRSIGTLSTGSVEVIIVDDASSDDTADVADEIAVSTPAVVVHHVINTGVVATRNDGLERARGKFVLFLDGDDEMRPGALDALTSAFIEDDIVAVAGRFVAVDENGAQIDIGTWTHEQLRPVIRRRGEMIESPKGLNAEAMLTRLVTPPPGAVMVRRSALQAVGGYDPRVKRSEDLEMLVRLSSLGRIVGVDALVLNYRRQSSQRSAATRRRQIGRLFTLAMLIVRAPSSRSARSRARGAAAHYLDRGETRWRYGNRGVRDAVAAARYLALATFMKALGQIVRMIRWPL